MADGKGDATAAAGAGAGAEAPAVAGAEVETESMARGHRPASPASGAPGLRPCLWQLETELREQEVSEVSSLSYCRSFCQTLLQYASNKNASEHIVYLLEVYRLAIQSFASARPFLTTECEDVLLVLGRLVLSCFELLLSVSESELPCEVWVPFLQSLQESHDALLEFGNNNLQILVHVTKEGVWKNPILLKILSQQPVETEEEKFIKFNEEITKREIPGIYSQPVRNRREIMEEGKENILDILRLDEILGKDPEFQLQEMSIPFSRKFKSFMQRLKEAKNFP